MSEAADKARAAKAASVEMALASEDVRNEALAAMAETLRANAVAIVHENERDMEIARKRGTGDSMLDRLMLDEGRVNDMADALEDLVKLPDPLGQVQVERALYNGLRLRRVSVPLGVVAVVYEARPNVTADATGIALKSGNAVVLRGGSLAANSNKAIADALHGAAVSAGLPQGCIQCIEATDRAETDELMSLHGVVDVLVPRGGAGLIAHCVEHSKVPVIETGTGNCHVYVHESADLAKAHDIVMNAKCRRYGVCNAAETLLVDEGVAEAFLPQMLESLAAEGVTLHCDDLAFECALRKTDANGRVEARERMKLERATEDDWATEYLAPELAVRCVAGLDDAIDHVNRYSTKHSEAIVAEDPVAVAAFERRVDAAVVYANASTAFTDGGQFGLGAEIGISTQKLHVRGPFALEALTSYKYIVEGEGQVRA